MVKLLPFAAVGMVGIIVWWLLFVLIVYITHA
jgi:putative flippase GtrA